MSELRKVYTTVDARDRIVEGALTVFAQRGFDGATTREIAKEAGVSVGLIHHHFSDKGTLWQLVGSRISEEFVEAMAGTTDAAQQGATQGLRTVMAAYMDYWRTHPRALRFQLWRVLGAPEEERKARSQSLNQMFVPFFEALQKTGQVRDDVPPGLLMVTLGGLVQYFLHSDVETNDALAVTGAAPLDHGQALDYLISLVATPAPAPPRKARRASSGSASPSASPA